MNCVGDDTLLCIHPGSFEAIGEKSGMHKLAGKKFAETEKVILHARSELSICRDAVDQGVQELERILQFGAQAPVFLRTQKFCGNLCVSLAEACKNLFGGFALPF